MKNKFRDEVISSIREIVFGLEDSLVSTLGAITGIAAGTNSSYLVLLSGIVIIVVESTSMAAGSYLSEKAAIEVKASGPKTNSRSGESPLRAGGVMFVFYILGGMIPLTPYLLFPVGTAFWPSIALTLSALFFVGVWKAGFTHRSWLKSGLEMMVVSMTAAILGYIIGRVFAATFGVTI